MTLSMTLAPADPLEQSGDVIAAIQAWVTAQGHQMNATIAPVFLGNGQITVILNS